MTKEYETIGFRIYLYKGTIIPQSAKGHIVLLNNQGKQIDQLAFNHWDEIPPQMRKLLRRNNIKRNFWHKDKLIAEFH